MTSKRYFGSIRQRESGRWQIRYRTRDGKRVSHPVTFTRRSDAARVLAELERQAQSGGPLVDTARGRVPVRDYAEHGSTSTQDCARGRSRCTGRCCAVTSFRR